MRRPHFSPWTKEQVSLMTFTPSPFSAPSPVLPRVRWVMAPLLALLLVLTGCDSTGADSDDGATSPVALAFQIGPGAASPSTLAKSTQLTDGDGTTLTLDRIEIILSEIEFERDD